MLQHEFATERRTPGRPIRVVIESERLSSAAIGPLELGGIDVTICSGPRSPSEPCPLVVDGHCPACECDVVVSSLQGAWAGAVHAAWLDRDTVATRLVDDGLSSVDDTFDAHVGVALQALFRAAYEAGARP